MDKLSEHYGLLLGLDDSWEASDVDSTWRASGWRFG